MLTTLSLVSNIPLLLNRPWLSQTKDADKICNVKVTISNVRNTDWRRQKLPDQVSFSLKTHQGSCQTIVDVLSTVTMWMELRVT